MRAWRSEAPVQAAEGSRRRLGSGACHAEGRRRRGAQAALARGARRPVGGELPHQVGVEVVGFARELGRRGVGDRVLSEHDALVGLGRAERLRLENGLRGEGR